MTGLKIIKDGETKNMLDFVEIETGLKFYLMKERFAMAIQELQLWQQNCNANNFSAELYKLICKADDVNKQKFLKGFPDETIAYLLWYRHESETDFFEGWKYFIGEDNE